MYPQLIAETIRQEALPESYGEDASAFFVPLFQRIVERLKQGENHDIKHKSPLIIGINGAQGTGKSTLALLLSRLLEADGVSVANLSIDDFYLSRAQRQRLSREVHPLFASRGVPGTHDIKLLQNKMAELATATASDLVSLPAFDKATDDCIAADGWPRLRGPVDVVLLEGWFIGAKPQAEGAVSEAINELEQKEDPDQKWRRHVNQQLDQHYRKIFQQLDMLIMLKAPSFEQVYQWRSLQEEKLRDRSPDGANAIMDSAQLRRFISHFERLTRHCLDTIPSQADIVFLLNEDHRVSKQLD